MPQVFTNNVAFKSQVSKLCMSNQFSNENLSDSNRYNSKQGLGIAQSQNSDGGRLDLGEKETVDINNLKIAIDYFLILTMFVGYCTRPEGN